MWKYASLNIVVWGGGSANLWRGATGWVDILQFIFDTRGCERAPMRKSVATFATVLLLSLTIFFLGPQLGSLDIDGDGVPDVPVMVMLGGADLNLQTPQNNGRARIHDTMESPFSRLTSNQRCLTGVDLRGSMPDSVTPLRC